MNSVVILEGLSKIYQSDGISVEALKNIHFKIGKGEFVTLAGPSGSGKTTLLNLIGALDRPSTGKILVHGKDLSQLSGDERALFRLRRVGFVFQTFNLIHVLTALENVEYVMLLQGTKGSMRRAKARKLLQRVGLENYFDTLPSKMSGGQQQRVAVARALATHPDLILADEPTANLDSVTGSDLIDLFRELCRDYQTTFIVASHDPMVIEKTQRLIRLHDGEVVDDR